MSAKYTRIQKILPHRRTALIARETSCEDSSRRANSSGSYFRCGGLGGRSQQRWLSEQRKDLRRSSPGRRPARIAPEGLTPFRCGGLGGRSQQRG